MKIDASSQPDVMRLQSSLGCARIMFLFSGALLIVSSLLPLETRDGNQFPWYIGFPVGFTLIVAGTYRRSIKLDRAAGTAEIKKSVAGLVYYRTSQSLSDFHRVSLGHITRSRGSSGGRHLMYYVTLAGDSSLDLTEQSVVERSRVVAEQLATFLDLPLQDSTTGNITIRDPGSLALSVADRARQSGKRDGMPERPLNLQTAVEFTGSSTATLKIPAVGWSLKSVLEMSPLWLFGGFLIWMFHDIFDENRGTAEYVMGFTALTFGGLCTVGTLIMVLQSFTKRITVQVSHLQMVVKSVSCFRRRTQVIDARSILDIECFDAKKLGWSQGNEGKSSSSTVAGIGIRTNRKTIRIGSHLPKADRIYICQLVTAILQK